MRTSMIDDAAAMELYSAGKRDCEIAEELNVSRYVVQWWRTRKGLIANKRKPPEKMPDFVKNELEARELGITYGQLVALRYDGGTA